MNQCKTCANQVPVGRVIVMCDGCLALYYYRNALDQIIDLLQDDGRLKLGLMQEIARKAIQAVPGASLSKQRAVIHDYQRPVIITMRHRR